MTVIDEIAAERRRQIEVEGWTIWHDLTHPIKELLLAAVCYRKRAEAGVRRSDISPDVYVLAGPPLDWPWGREWWKPKNPRRDLIRAGALALAEKDTAIIRGSAGLADTADREYRRIVAEIERLDREREEG